MFAAGNLLPCRFCFFFSEDKKIFSEKKKTDSEKNFMESRKKIKAFKAGKIYRCSNLRNSRRMPSHKAKPFCSSHSPTFT